MWTQACVNPCGYGDAGLIFECETSRSTWCAFQKRMTRSHFGLSAAHAGSGAGTTMHAGAPNTGSHGHASPTPSAPIPVAAASHGEVSADSGNPAGEESDHTAANDRDDFPVDIAKGLVSASRLEEGWTDLQRRMRALEAMMTDLQGSIGRDAFEADYVTRREFARKVEGEHADTLGRHRSLIAELSVSVAEGAAMRQESVESLKAVEDIRAT